MPEKVRKDIWIDPELLEKVKEIGARTHRKATQVIIDAIVRYVNEFDNLKGGKP